MVGDGLNDAGGLKRSDVGISVADDISAFLPACDAILDARALPNLDRMLTFSRASLWVVRAAFGLSFLYNVVGLSLAASGHLSPLVCAVLMPVSSITVVLFAVGATLLTARMCKVVAS